MQGFVKSPRQGVRLGFNRVRKKLMYTIGHFLTHNRAVRSSDLQKSNDLTEHNP